MVKVTPSGVGFGVGVTAVCGDAGDAGEQLDAHQHGEVLVHRVVAVVDVGAAVLAELHLERDAARRRAAARRPCAPASRSRGSASPPRSMVTPSSKWRWIGWSQPPPPLT